METKHTLVMVLLFIFGGFLLVNYVFTTYSLIWVGEAPQTENMTALSANRTGEYHPERQSREIPGVPPFIPRRTFQREQLNPLDILIAPSMMFNLVGGLISIAGAITIRGLTHTKELRKMRKDLADLYLTDEEKEVMAEIEKVGAEVTQKELTDRTGYSRVKMHRVIQKLESKKIVRKIPCGQTNKIILETKK
jgi:uncharacterized membrane protein